MMISNYRRTVSASLLLLTGGLLAVIGAEVAARPAETGWRSDPAWHQGKAEWALYDAVRPIYGQPRRYEATIYTNKQHMDRATGTKAADWRAESAFEVFKHNVSEMIPTPNYTYRFLTTSFVGVEDVEPYKVVMSSQEDCGATYKQIVVANDVVSANQHSYFPNQGTKSIEYPDRDTAFHDTLSLTLRDYPFESAEKPVLRLRLVPDQTDTHETSQQATGAVVRYMGRETLDLPYGKVDAHHLRVFHDPDGGTKETDYWFAADPAMRHVMVRYAGPYGVRYELKKLAWWAYWDQSTRRPE